MLDFYYSLSGEPGQAYREALPPMFLFKREAEQKSYRFPDGACEPVNLRFSIWDCIFLAI